MSRWRRPEPLASTHDTAEFDCGDPTLNQWLKRYALTNHRSGAARVFVSTSGETQDGKVLGYYSLSSASAFKQDMPDRVGKAMPEPIPLILLGRLAVDSNQQGSGLGAGLLRDAIQRTLTVADSIGVRALVVHAVDERAAAYYGRFGFVPSPTDHLHLALILKDARAVLESKSEG